MYIYVFHLFPFQMILFRLMWTLHNCNTFKLRVSAPPPVFFFTLFSFNLSSLLSLSHLFSFIILAPTSTPALSAQGKVAQTACMSACKHLSTSLMQMLLDTELKQISMGAIQQFNLDVIQCERKLDEARFWYFTPNCCWCAQCKPKLHQKGMRVSVTLDVTC